MLPVNPKTVPLFEVLLFGNKMESTLGLCLSWKQSTLTGLTHMKNANMFICRAMGWWLDSNSLHPQEKGS